MKALLPFLFAFLAAAPPQETPVFNGKDLSGWYTWLEKQGRNNDPHKVFTVEDGVIRASGTEFGYIATEQEHENYTLTLEFKWGQETHAPRKTQARDSGILFHVTGPDKIWPRSVEFQIIEGGTGDILLVDGASMEYDPALRARMSRDPKKMLSPDGTRIVTGRVNWEKRSPQWKDVVGFRGTDDLEKPLGEWNALKLVCRDGSFEYFVNGTQVASGRGASPSRGRIVLQSEGAEIFFRKIELVSTVKK